MEQDIDEQNYPGGLRSDQEVFRVCLVVGVEGRMETLREQKAAMATSVCGESGLW